MLIRAILFGLAWVLLSALQCYTQAWKPGVKDYNYTQIADAAALRRGTLNYTDATGANLTAYVSYSNTSSQPRPAVIVVPDYDGIGNYERWRADLLASLGYVGFVADIYNNSVAQGPALPEANRFAAMAIYNGNLTLLHSRLLGALATVRKHPQVQADRVAAIGYCFGGAAVIEFARLWPNTPGLQGVASFHGSPLVRNSSTFKPGTNVSVAIFNGYDDSGAGVSAKAKAEVQAELEGANATWSFTDYSHTAHAFTLPSNPLWTSGPAPQSAYSPWADRQSWWALRSFLLTVFDLGNLTNPYTSAGGVTYDYNSPFIGSAPATS
ncbi:hypothetical protein WJX81_007910 [Elliptochloris bilobata]|uniref:Dienelactone hydrolase domain-containing protein n=1 Tax=Elliptochloris bilobata TaxID=381761 RepID=A0AAW1SE75_9CHLO